MLVGAVTKTEIERRYAVVREAMDDHGIDALVVAGSEYTGFEGAVRYLSGFRILHRYAYVVLPVEGEPSVVFPREARWVGDHGEVWVEEAVFAERAWSNGTSQPTSSQRPFSAE